MAEEARGICVRDVSATAFIKAYAEHLKNSDKFDLPVWSDTIKTAVFKELAPYGDDWYYIRAASIARKVYLRPGIGMGQLQKWYGGAYRRGARTEHFRKAASGVIRSVLLQLEEMKVVEKLEAGGRRVTVVGQQDLDRVSSFHEQQFLASTMQVVKLFCKIVSDGFALLFFGTRLRDPAPPMPPKTAMKNRH